MILDLKAFNTSIQEAQVHLHRSFSGSKGCPQLQGYAFPHRDTIVMQVLSEVCVEQQILAILSPSLCASYSALHLHQVCRAILFYLDRTKSLQKLPMLFLAYTERVKGEAVSMQKISNWITQCIRPCYELASVQLPSRVGAGFIRVQFTSVASLVSLPIQDFAEQQPGNPYARL